MMQIGSDVIYNGKIWNNQVYGIQPVWGVKESAREDEIPQQPEKEEKKSFAELLEEEIIKIKDLEH